MNQCLNTLKMRTIKIGLILDNMNSGSPGKTLGPSLLLDFVLKITCH